MKSKQLVVLGGTGFVGRHLCRRLVRDGHQVKIVSRNRESARAMLVLPSATVVPGDVHRPGVLEAELRGADAVINLVGVLHSGRGRSSFSAAHEALPERVATVCRELGVPRLLHMSGLHASPDGPSEYLKSRGRGENAAFKAAGGAVGVTSFRPSVIFGPDDSFTNRFADLLRVSPGFIPLACAKARFQPVHVEDVVTAMADSLSNPATVGQRYDLVGPAQYTLHEIVAFIDGLIGTNRRIMKFGTGMSKLMAFFLQFAPGKPLTPDNVRSMSVDSVNDAGFPAVFGITPASMESIVPGYLAPQRSQLDEFRARPRRGGALFGAFSGRR